MQLLIDFSAPSREAHTSHITSGRMGDNMRLVLDRVKEMPGSTSGELAKEFVLDLTETRRRLTDLRKAGLIEKEDTRPCLVLGSKQTTYRIKSHGREALPAL